MSAAASVGRSKYLVLAGNEFNRNSAPLAEGEVVLDGWVTIGHEVQNVFTVFTDESSFGFWEIRQP
jgi:hypothetical protein